MDKVLLGLGANVAGPWGNPAETVSKAVARLASAGVQVTACSQLYVTRAVGPGNQPDYVNAVVLGRTRETALRLLVRLKQLERQAGRRLRRRWSARPLDIDILDQGSRVMNATGYGGWRLQLPHPELHKRLFVLAPLAEVAPRWRHPRLGLGADALLRRLPAVQRRRPIRTLPLEPCGGLCE
ncbi:MAG: 2-amino-4-hydroxy-6-hydroxymethyldihydropteridine diphosphokinase [Hyphomicrobiaceae bacterium]